MKNQIQVKEKAPANANQLTSIAKGALAKSASDRMAKLGEFRILTLRETPAYGNAENPEHSADYWRKNIDTDPRHNPDVESLVCLVLNTRREILGHFLVATGLLDTLLGHPREVFRPAIVANAAAIVVMHNLCAATHKLCYVKRRVMCSHRLAVLTLIRSIAKAVVCCNSAGFTMAHLF